jgi:hypothetical protein
MEKFSTEHEKSIKSIQVTTDDIGLQFFGMYFFDSFFSFFCLIFRRLSRGERMFLSHTKRHIMNRQMGGWASPAELGTDNKKFHRQPTTTIKVSSTAGNDNQKFHRQPTPTIKTNSRHDNKERQTTPTVTIDTRQPTLGKQRQTTTTNNRYTTILKNLLLKRIGTKNLSKELKAVNDRRPTLFFNYNSIFSVTDLNSTSVCRLFPFYPFIDKR